MSDTLIENQAPAILRTPRQAPRDWPAPAAFVLKRMQEMFGLDYRSLGLLRICIALCLLWVTYMNGSEMRAFYTDEGVLTRQELFQNPGGFLGFSLHFANGSMTYIGILFGLQFLFALMMLAGYRTKLATIGAYILLLSMQNRHPVLLFGADIALRVGLFWTIFLPLGARLSIDSLLGRARPPRNPIFLSLAGVAFILQICIIYTCSSLMKTGDTWRDHTAVSYALALDVYSRPLGHWLGQQEALTRFLTIFTLNLEMFGPLLFLLPIFSKWARMLGIALFAGMQIGFGLCMTMGTFGPVMISLTLALLPAFFWDRIAGPLGAGLARLFRPLAAVKTIRPSRWVRQWIDRANRANDFAASLTLPRGTPALRAIRRIAFECTLAFLLLVLLRWNWVKIPGHHKPLPQSLVTLANMTGMEQCWDMFAPDPHTTDGWFVISGRLHNGETINLFTGKAATFDKPACVADSYRNQLWMSYLISFWQPGSSNPSALARHLGTQWNQGHPYLQQVECVEIDMISDPIWPGPSKAEPTRLTIATEWF
jgi:hypothetical protein